MDRILQQNRSIILPADMDEDANTDSRKSSLVLTQEDSDGSHVRSQGSATDVIIINATDSSCSDAKTNNSTDVRSSSSCGDEAEKESSQPEAVQTTDSAKASSQMMYTICDVPPWYLCIVLGFQQFLTMLGSTFAIPSIIAPAMCIGPDDQVVTGEILGTLFFVSGFATLVQTTFGTRLPIVQGGTFAFLTSALAILSLDKWNCPTEPQLNSSSGLANETADVSAGEDVWKSRMLEIQGAIILASLFQVLIGITGMIGVVMRFISPITIAACISLIGMSLFRVASSNCAGNWWIAFMTMALIALFSQYLRNISIPWCTVKDRKCGKATFPLFRLFPIIIAIALSWFVCYILTITNAIPNDPNHWAYATRTDVNAKALQEASWFRFPYPFQWGIPTFSVASVFGMLPAVLAGIVESIGDYYACARISGATAPPVDAINRGIFVEGIMCVVAGMFGSGTGTTSYSENVGAIGITKCGSRRIIQTSGVIMLIIGVLGKFSALFITIPTPVIGGLFMVMFGMITAVGISNLQYVDLNSSRNLFIFGFSVMLGMSLPDWLQAHPEAINTGDEIFDQIVLVLGTTSMFVGGTMALILDNTVPGTDEERGLCKWQEELSRVDDVGGRGADMAPDTTYDLPFGMAAVRRWNWTKYLPICPTFTGFSICKESCSRCRHNEKKESNESNEDGIQCLAYDNPVIDTETLSSQPISVSFDRSATIAL